MANKWRPTHSTETRRDSDRAWGRRGWRRDLNISKTLSNILRHKASSLGLYMRSDGYCEVSEVLKTDCLEELGCTWDDIQRLIDDSDKKRWEVRVEKDKVLIRAVQGHSRKLINDEEVFLRINPVKDTLPAVCVHGTYFKHYTGIKKADGLLVGGGRGVHGKQHVHFVPKEPDDENVIPGMRVDFDIAIWIDLQLTISDGFVWYKSRNGGFLTRGDENGLVAWKYFMKVVNLWTGSVLWCWEEAWSWRRSRSSTSTSTPYL